LALYAQHLASGHNLVSRALKCDTIQGYIRHCSQFLQLFPTDPYDYRYPSRASDTKKYHPYIQGVFDEVKRLETLKDKREPFTVDMLKALKTHVSESQLGPDTLHATLADWFECGLFLGIRLSEWAQHAGSHNIHSPQLNVFNDPQAFLRRDIAASDHDNRSPQDCLTDKIPDRMLTCFRTQKNGSYGEKVLNVHNPDGHSYNRAMHKIIQRHDRLVGHLPNMADIPLGLYYNSRHKEVRLITSDDIEKVMRESACLAYNLNPNKPSDMDLLRLWTSHSLRVGACTLLYAQSYDTIKIKKMLRWRSDSFMMYLRNLAVISLQHAKDMDTVAHIPNFF
jgi:hypothetical protein